MIKLAAIHRYPEDRVRNTVDLFDKELVQKAFRKAWETSDEQQRSVAQERGIDAQSAGILLRSKMNTRTVTHTLISSMLDDVDQRTNDPHRDVVSVISRGDMENPFVPLMREIIAA